MDHLQKNSEIRDAFIKTENVFNMIHDMVYGDYKDSAKWSASDKVLYSKAFEIANNPQCDGYVKKNILMVMKLLTKSKKDVE